MTTPRSATHGGEIPGGKTCSSLDPLTAEVTAWVLAECAGAPPKARYPQEMVCTVTSVSCVAIIVCWSCGEIRELDARW